MQPDVPLSPEAVGSRNVAGPLECQHVSLDFCTPEKGVTNFLSVLMGEAGIRSRQRGCSISVRGCDYRVDRWDSLGRIERHVWQEP